MPHTLLDPTPVRGAADLRSVDEALTHWQSVRAAEAGRGEHWISIAFEIARRERDRGSWA